ncbi:RrF2 family transcriptional regulator [Planotetraspora kaengkrachanensis]|uniref:Transcriptional regulator n=1 Tax=Planotetraspora kaengkrachanensis TaxID=575193 RepID=A0A8J3PQM5_9ACTN|nr:Rrf2 family transcriptional regulator [Planotetraspora kaengkrachanensis]GIG77569.1 transcriptional regulator [Planotetraspora kaengkrachanensis]
MSEGVEWAVHCCVVLTSVAAPVPAARLAELHQVSPTYLAKQLQALARAGLVFSVQGKSGGYVLSRPPAEITLLDVVEAIDGPEPAFVCTEIRQRGPMATPAEYCTTPCPISRAMAASESARRDALRSVTIAGLAEQVEAGSGAGTLNGVAAWLGSTGT